MSTRTTEQIAQHLKYFCDGVPSASGLRVAALLEAWDGLHHFEPSALKKVDWTNPRFQVLKLNKGHNIGGLATHDFDTLTRLVFLAHDHCIRVGIGPVNQQMLEFMFHPRDCRHGTLPKRHPTIEDALSSWRNTHPPEEPAAPAEMRVNTRDENGILLPLDLDPETAHALAKAGRDIVQRLTLKVMRKPDASTGGEGGAS